MVIGAAVSVKFEDGVFHKKMVNFSEFSLVAAFSCF